MHTCATRKIVFAAACIFFWREAKAFDYAGRLTLGAFTSRETHKTLPLSAQSNDFAIVSSRFYYKATRINDSYLSFTSDLRDKHDFFDKLDRERQILTTENTFQARQVSLKMEPPDNGLLWEVGRFPVPEAGAAFTDGGELGWRVNRNLRGGAFGGLNPKQIDKSYLESNSKASNYGLFVDLNPRYDDFARRTNATAAVVSEVYNGQVDRRYFYNNTVYQWDNDCALTGLLYLDFVPRSYIQNGLLSYSQRWITPFRSIVSFFTYDTIEYRRRQDLRETLDPSPYREGQLQLRWTTQLNLQLDLTGRYGKRDYDGLSRENIEARVSAPRWFSPNLETSLRASHKKEFLKKGDFGGVGLGYFSKGFEGDLSLDYGAETQSDLSQLHPLVVEMNSGFFLSGEIFGAAGLQYATDEKVDIVTLFVKFAYRFGKEGVPPIRDGASPRGRL